MAKNIVIGIGNLLFCDDGVGVISASYLEKNFDFSPEFEVLDGGTLGFGLLEYFVNYDNVFIIDTLSAGGEAGEIYKIPSNELLGGNSYKKTAHEVEVLQMLEACQLYDTQANITIFGIIAQNISSVQIGLSETLKSKFDMLIETIINSVQELDVNVTRKGNFTLEEVVAKLKC